MAGKKALKDAAKSNPTALGDPISLKAEQSDTSPIPTEEEKRDAQNPAPQQQQQQQQHQQRGEKRSLKQRAEQDLDEARKGNRSMLGDPVSLKAETSAGDPVPDADENEKGKGKGRDSKL
ncbi:hypothetical protein AYL99_00436 [Fonsecaea erecta]|uniref:Uncharacterized protein n=1 Tax=Fonsecaea erecta TaxID=1367422 RepID=A0A178ZXF0_9EURO|nr:hypothetical protein AYL99_00436 [Fonsecaea erecta]OAP64464.1 hypothetical protein AYL99_00436 [Fonsecaea erecta]